MPSDEQPFDKSRTDFHMSASEFRRYGHAAVDWIAGYMGRLEDLPVLSRVSPGDIRSRLPARAPVSGEGFETVLKDFETLILPGITHWQSPRFLAFFPANSSGPAILGELLSAGLGVQGMLWTTSPACTELETHVLDWLVEMMKLPDGFLSTQGGGGVIQDSASSATLCAVLAARERSTGYQSNKRGTQTRLTAYASDQAHSSVEKAIRIAGLGSDNLRLIGSDSRFALRPASLEKAIQQDLDRGFRPCFACATIGTTSSNAMDPLGEIGAICRKHELWLHVDAAMSGTAAICPEFRYIHSGLELADSYCFNPHKWMFVNFDCDCFYVADRNALIRALSVLPEYLKNPATESGEVIDYRDWQIPLGRRFRALKLWFVIRHYGVDGLRHHIRRHVDLAKNLVDWIRADPRFELAAPVPLNLVCFRHKHGDEVNQRILTAVNDTGEVYMTQTRLEGKLTLRLSIGQTRTELRHVRLAWDLIQSAANDIDSSS